MGVRCDTIGERHAGQQRHGGTWILLCAAVLVAAVAIPALGAVELSPHCAKHASEALSPARIQRMLASGECVEARRYCDAERGLELYLCTDPRTGLVGGLILAGDVVVTGYGARAAYWQGKIGAGRQWGPCGGVQ